MARIWHKQTSNNRDEHENTLNETLTWLSTGMPTGGFATFLLLWTVTIMLTELSTHLSSLGQGTSSWFHFLGSGAFMTTSIAAAFLLLRAVTVICTIFSTYANSSDSQRTDPRLIECWWYTDSTTIKDTALVRARAIFITSTSALCHSNHQSPRALSEFNLCEVESCGWG